MKMKLCTYVLLLTCCSSMMSMTPDKQLVSLDHGKLDPLKSKIMTQIDRFSEPSALNFTTAERVLKVVNQCTDENRSTNWVQCVKGLKDLEKSQVVPKPLPLLAAGLSALNLVWLGYPLFNKIFGAEQLCYLEEMDGMMFPLLIANYAAFTASLIMLSNSTSCGNPSKRLTKKLRDHIKEQESLGNHVMRKGLEPIFAQFTRKQTALYPKLLEAAQFAELPDGSIDVAQFKKAFPQLHGLDADGLRYLLAFSFLLNVLPSALCGPGMNSEWAGVWVVPGVMVALFNAGFGAGTLGGGYSGARKQVSTDIRSVINLIQDHLDDEQRAPDDMV